MKSAAIVTTHIETLARAVEMLRIAADYIKDHCAEETIFYDDAECDGYCVSDDCRIAADDLNDNRV